MPRHRSPWDVLGLAPGCTERDVRSAYARTLKVTRPEDDPVAFQRLVEARDYVLMLARAGITAVEFEDHEDDAEHDEDAEPPEPGFQPEPLTPLMDLAPASPPEALTKSADAAEPLLPAPSIDATPIEPVALAPVAAPIAPVEMAPAAPMPASEPVIDVRQLFAEIIKRLGSDATLADLADWKTWVASLGRLDHDERAKLDPEFLRALPLLLQPIARQTAVSPPTQVRSLFGLLKPRRIGPNYARAAEQANLVVALDEEFGWTRYDRHVFDVLDYKDALLVLAILSGLVRSAAARRDGPPRRRDSNGLPVLDERDVRAYFGSQSPSFSALYEQARLRGRWSAEWDRSRALFAPWYFVKYRLWELVAVWIAALIFGLWADRLARQLPVGLYEQLRETPYLATALYFTPLACVHLYYAVYGHIRHFERATRVASGLDRRFLFAPAARAQALQSASGQTQGTEVKFKIPPLAWAMLAYFLIRALGLFNQNSTPTPIPYQFPSGLPKTPFILPGDREPGSKEAIDREIARILDQYRSGKKTSDEAFKDLGALRVPKP